MTITVSKEIRDKVKDFNILAYKFPIEIKETSEDIKDRIKYYEEKYANMPLEDVINLERIKEARDGYKAFGKDPSRYRLACESLLRRLSKQMGLYTINNAVDIGNLLSIELNRSTAVLDYDKILGDVRIRMGTSEDIYYGIGRGLINVTNIPLYCDNDSPFGSPTSDTLRTSITFDTKNILLFVICFSDKYIDECDKITQEMFKELGNVCEFSKVTVIYE